MSTAKIFINGKSQAVRLPKECRFTGTEVGVARVGEMVVLFPKDRAWDIFTASEPVTDDFCDAILKARAHDAQPSREGL
jgi:antitoxin VapB